MLIDDLIKKLHCGTYYMKFKSVYGDNDAERQAARYEKTAMNFLKYYPSRKSYDVSVFSAPGRTEIGGNHTDHQHGYVLAAAVNLDVIAIAAFHNDNVIRIKSEGYVAFEVKLDDLAVRGYCNESSELVRGIAARFIEMGVRIGGFDLYSTSDVLSGSGISSSAAFEILIGTIINEHYNEGKANAVNIAKIGQYAENVYFGKNSGFMDQMVSSVGGLVGIDFNDIENPEIKSIDCRFEKFGYCICITDTKGSHADLTDDYAAVRLEMECVAGKLGSNRLRSVDEKIFYSKIPIIRQSCSDRAILRAAHFFDENRRARQEAEALENGEFELFLELVKNSGDSSAVFLQNLYSVASPENQGITLAILISKKILGCNGAVRVHGGGFAGTIQAIVPCGTIEIYESEMNRIFGEGACKRLYVRPIGGLRIIS